MPAVLFPFACLCGTPCCKVGAQKCSDGASLRGTGETRCVDGLQQECSGPLNPDLPQFWRLRDETCD